ncbi:phage portal protein, partial [Bacillus thuringiensis]|nr:phage portal protein [Bacillus thuringiensis]MDR5022465.1 phage portal protein [Bacillus thuringiensis]
MGLRDRFSNYLFKKAEKRGYLDDVLGKSIRYGGVYVTDSNILQSSDVYELLQDISNQMVLADIVVEDEFGNETKDDIALRILKNPNDYLTQS